LTTAPVPAKAAPAVVIHVNDDAAPGGNGAKNAPFNNLPDAVEAARRLPGAVTIKVEPGDYALTETLLIDRPLDLRGSTEQVDGSDSWPTGEVVAGTATRLFALNPALTRLVLVDRGDGTVLGGVDISGFVFEGTVTGISLLLNRVQGYRIDNN